MAALTGCTTKQMIPNADVRGFWVFSPSTMDSADTIDVSSITATGGDTVSVIYYAYAYDITSGDTVTTTWSGTTITVDAGGATTNHEYAIHVVGSNQST